LAKAAPRQQADQAAIGNSPAIKVVWARMSQPLMSVALQSHRSKSSFRVLYGCRLPGIAAHWRPVLRMHRAADHLVQIDRRSSSARSPVA
jgi:hypothetical protein